MVVSLGQQYNIGEKPTVMLYTYINRHAGTPEKQRRQNSTSSNMAVIIYCYIGCEAEVTTLKREQRGPWCRYLEHNPESTRHRYAPGSLLRMNNVSKSTTAKFFFSVVLFLFFFPSFCLARNPVANIVTFWHIGTWNRINPGNWDFSSIRLHGRRGKGKTESVSREK